MLTQIFFRLILDNATTYGYDTAYCLKSHSGARDIVGRSGYFSLNLSANSVMRGRLDARRTLKSLVADLRLISGAVELRCINGICRSYRK